ncbi:MAG: hypothetical protein E7294_05465 [Lachnospiraceae bacterium]|nr:hypothetical protein [Lachnospiraceae bacterium]
MSTTEERIERIHERAKERRQEKRRRLLQIERTAAVALSVVLVFMIGFFGSHSAGGAAGVVVNAGYAGASMLTSAVGGYVLIAIIAFLLGVIVTALIKQHRGDDSD